MSRTDQAIGWGLVVAFVGASLAIDAYAAYHLGSTQLSTAILVVLALAGCIFKAAGLHKARTAYDYDNNRRQWGRTLAILLLFAVAWAQSISYELTFYGQNYGDAFAEKQGAVDKQADLKSEKAALETGLATRATKRTPAVVEADITAALGRRIGDAKAPATLAKATGNCTNAKAWAYQLCGPVLALRTELAQAQAIAGVERRLAEIRQAGGWTSVNTEAHAGAAFITRTLERVGWMEVKKGNVHLVLDALVLIGMIVVQLGATLAYVAWFSGPKAGASRQPASGQEGARLSLWSRLVRALMPKPANDAGPAVGPMAGPEVEAASPERGNVVHLPVKVSGTELTPVNDTVPEARLRHDLVDKATELIAAEAANGDEIEPDDIEGFLLRYTEMGESYTERAADLYRVYIGVVGEKRAVSSRTFIKGVVQALKGAGGWKHKDASSYVRIHGARFNEQGCKLHLQYRQEDNKRAAAGEEDNRHAAAA